MYIDGFNLYYGLKESNFRRFYWLNVHQLAKNLLKPNQELNAVHYFTARISSPSGKSDAVERQNTYLDALETLPNTHLHYGHYLAKQRRCRNCNASWQTYEEKMTDVKIAMNFLIDAQDNAFDTALIVSADGDLTPIVETVLCRYPNKRVVIAFPPRRFSAQLKETASASFTIGRKKLKDSQLPDQVESEFGFILSRPLEWH